MNSHTEIWRCTETQNRDGDEVRHPRAHAYAQRYRSQRSLADRTVPGSAYRGDERAQRERKPCGNEYERGYVFVFVNVVP